MQKAAICEMTAALVTSDLPRRRPGRPKGSKSQLVQDPRTLGVHHFAFLRSQLYGLDIRESFERYLGWCETSTDLRHIEYRHQALLDQVIQSACLLDAALPTTGKITDLIATVRDHTKSRPAVQLPPLDEWAWAQGIDVDAWSEADLLAEYQAAFGLNNPDALEQEQLSATKDKDARRVRALNHLETLLAVPCSAQDHLQRWFARPVATKLRNLGLLNLQDLCDFINLHGYRWHGRVKGLGATRAKRMVDWLRSQQGALGLVLGDAVDAPSSLQRLRTSTPENSVVVQPPVAPGNLHCEAWPQENAAGVFRSHMANTLGADTDIQAVTAWLSRYDEKPDTLRNYRKEVERFMLWCQRVLEKPLSSVTAPDCQQYRMFLQSVPAHWIHPLPVARHDPQWRAFRRQPNPASQKQALVIVQTLFEGLRDAGYLVANPMRSVMKGFVLPTSKLDTTRSFTQAEWAHVQRQLLALPIGAHRLRLQCILELLVRAGLRLDELASAGPHHIRMEYLPDHQELPPMAVLTVTGKRNKVRDVPLAEDVVMLLSAHQAPFLERDAQLVDKTDLRLIRALGSSVPQWERGPSGEVAQAVVTKDPGAPLSAAGIYAVLKRFFRHAASTAAEHGLVPERFESASTHWLRHTFARNALVNGVPVEIVSDLMGHASISTTSIYSSQELARKMRAVQAMAK